MRLRALVLCHLLLAGNAGCDSDDDASQEAPTLYVSQSSYEPEKIGQMTLSPSHRRGPNVLPDNELSVLPITVWAPRSAVGSLPVVLWSHGGGSRRNPGSSGEKWAATFAQAGYAVVAMHHMARSRADLVQNICAPNGIAEPQCDQTTYVPYYESTDRPQDAVAVMDAFAAIGAEYGIELDVNRVAIAGHSGGTNSPLYLAGGIRNALAPEAPGELLFSLSDNRPRAFITMSPSGAAAAGWKEDTLAAVTRPMLSATGAGDIEPDTRKALHDALGPGDKYRLYLNHADASHSVFNLELGAHELHPTFRDFLAASAHAFLDAHLLDDEVARAWLASDDLGRLVDDVVAPDDTTPSWDAR